MQYVYRYVRRRTASGLVVGTVEDCMARIHDYFIDCAVYLYPSERQARTGVMAGGSGFLVEMGEHVYVVTAAHVILKDRAYCPRLNKYDGQHEAIPLSGDDWVCSVEDDLAVAIVDMSQGFNYKTVPMGFLISREQFFEESVFGPGNEVFLVGRFVNHEGKQRNLPCVRFGSIAMVANENEKVLISKNPKKEQEAFLVEVHTKSGYSGSPVFIPNPNCTVVGLRGNTIPRVQDGPWLLGVHIGQIKNTNETAAKIKEEETDTGMAIVIPAWRLKTLLDDRRLNLKRQKANEHATKQRSREPVALESLSGEQSDEITKSEFEKALKKVSRKRQAKPSESDQGTS
jgi:hypothetical protein